MANFMNLMNNFNEVYEIKKFDDLLKSKNKICIDDLN